MFESSFEPKEEKRKMTKVDLEKLGLTKTDKGYESKSTNLKSSDIGQRGTITQAVINKAEMVDFNDEAKIVLTVTVPDMEKDGEGRTLPLNVTNSKACLDMFGDEFENWENKMLEIRIESTPYAGNVVDCMRLYEYKE